MSEPSHKLLRALEQATAAEPPQGTLDPETASLRQTWLALGQLLESSNPPDQAPPVVQASARKARRRRGDRIIVIVAIAVSLLVVAVSLWSATVTNPSNRAVAVPKEPALPIPQPTPEKAIAKNEASRSLAAKTPTSPEKAISPPAAVPDGFQWDDAIDDQLAQVGQDLVRCEQGWNYRVERVEVLQYAIRQMEEDDGENKL